jgi:hypothetical protein
MFLPEEWMRNDESKAEAGLPALPLTLPDQARDCPYILYLYCFSLKREWGTMRPRLRLGFPLSTSPYLTKPGTVQILCTCTASPWRGSGERWGQGWDWASPHPTWPSQGPSIYCVPVLLLPEEGVRNDEAKVEAGLPALHLTPAGSPGPSIYVLKIFWLLFMYYVFMSPYSLMRWIKVSRGAIDNRFTGISHSKSSEPEDLINYSAAWVKKLPANCLKKHIDCRSRCYKIELKKKFAIYDFCLRRACSLVKLP